MAIVGEATLTIVPKIDELTLRREVERSMAKVAQSSKFVPKVDTTKAAAELERGLTGAIARAGSRLETKFAGVNDFLTRLGPLGTAAGTALGFGLAQGVEAGVRTIVKFVGDSIQAASSLAEQQNAVRVVFDESAESVLGFAESTAVLLGQTEQEFNKNAAAFGSLFTNMGIAKEEAALLATTAVQLASDLASLRDVPVEEALTRLQSGLVGETEAIRRFGVDVTEATVTQRALQMGLAGTAEELTQGDKVLARYALTLEQTTDAQGDFLRTSDSVANQQRILNAELERSKTQFGQNLQGPMKETLKFLNQILSAGEERGGLRILGPGLGFVEGASNLTKIKQILIGVTEEEAKAAREAQRLNDNYLKAFNAISAVSGAAKTAAVFTEELANAAAKAASAFQARFEGLLPKFGDDFREEADKTVGGAKRAADAAKRLERAQRDAAQGIGDAQERLAEAIEDGHEQVIDAQDRLVEATQDSAEAIAEAQERVGEAQEAAAERSREAQERLVDAQRATAERVKDAQAAIVRATEDGAERIQDAQERLADAIEDSQERIQSAQERAADSRRSSARRIEDAEKALRRAQEDAEKAGKDDVSTQRRLEDAKTDLARAHEDSAEAITEADQAVVDAQTEGLERIKEATEALTEAQEESTERVVEANRALVEAQVEGNRQVAEAQREILKAQKEGARAIQDAQEALTEAQTDGAKRIAEANEAVAQAQEEAAKRVADAQRDLARAQEDAADRIIDAQEAIASAAGGAAKKQQIHAKDLAESFRKNAADLEGFASNLTDIGRKIEGTADQFIVKAFLAKLGELGPGALPLIKEINTLTKPELDAMVKLFGDEVQAAKDAADEKWAKFPENFAGMTAAARDAVVPELQKLVDDFDELPVKTGKPVEKSIEQIKNFALGLQAAAATGKIALDGVEQALIKDIINPTKSANEKVEALRQLLDKLSGKRVPITFELDAVTSEAFRAARGTGGAQPRQLGGTVIPGHEYLVGERGPELVVPTGPGFVINNPLLIRLIEALESSRTMTATAAARQTREIGRPSATQGSLTVVVQEASHPHAVAREVMREWGRQVHR